MGGYFCPFAFRSFFFLILVDSKFQSADREALEMCVNWGRRWRISRHPYVRGIAFTCAMQYERDLITFFKASRTLYGYIY